MKYTHGVLLSLLVVFSSCKNEESFKTDAMSAIGTEKKEEFPQEPPQGLEKDETRNTKTKSAGSESKPVGEWDKKIIKVAELTVEVKSAANYRINIAEFIKESGGYVSKEALEQVNGITTNSLSIKVPVDQFENLMIKLTSDSIHVLNRSISTEDVGAEYYDIRSRVESKNQMRLKYLDFMKQAKNMEEVLSIQTEVNNLQEQIDAAKGRVSFLSQSSAMSTIHLNFTESGVVAVNIPEEGTYWDRVKDSIKSGLSWIGEIVLVVLSIWPLVLGIAFLVLFYRKRIGSKIAPTANVDK